MDTLVHSAGIAAYFFSASSILSSLALIIMFAGVRIFGPLNDALSAFQFLFLIPVAYAIGQALRPGAPVISGFPTIIGIAAMLTFAGLQLLLVTGAVRFEQTLSAVLATGAVIGLWLVLIDACLLAAGHIPAWLAWSGIVGGASLVITATGWFFLGGMQHPAVAIGFGVGAILLPVWGVGIGRLLSGPLLPA